MRSFDDEHGGRWQAALLEASFGSVVLVFTRIGAEDVRQKPLDAANFHEAEQMLAGAEESSLQAWLMEAMPWS